MVWAVLYIEHAKYSWGTLSAMMERALGGNILTQDIFNVDMMHLQASEYYCLEPLAMCSLKLPRFPDPGGKETDVAVA